MGKVKNEEVILQAADLMAKLIEELSDEDLAELYKLVDNKLVQMPRNPHPTLLAALSAFISAITAARIEP